MLASPLFWFVLLALVCTLASSGTVYVSLAGQDVDGCGATLDSACSTIMGGLNQAANYDTVLLADGVYSGAGNENITLTASPVQHVIISGNINSTDKVIISCNEIAPAFSLNGLTMVSGLAQMSIANCQTTPDRTLQTGNGGAVFIRNYNSTFTISGVKFYNNSAVEAGGAIAASFVRELHIIDSEFGENFALIRGGAVSITTTNLTIHGSVFVDNVANGTEIVTTNAITYETGGRGGAFYGLSSTVSIYDTMFLNNTAVRSGGAVYNEDMLGVIIQYSEFSGNSATGGNGECPADASCLVRGGAFYSNNANNVRFSECKFMYNQVSTPNINQVVQGGAVYMISSATTVVISLEDAIMENCEFVGNMGVGRGENNGGGYGGALYIDSQTIHLLNCEFYDNWVGSNGLFSEFSSAGGAVWMGSSARSTLRSCNLHDNYVVGGYGGGLFAADSVDMVLDACTFRYNAAVSSYTVTGLGGAVMIAHQSRVNISHTAFSENNALPRLDLDPTSPLTFSGEGGGLYVQSATVTLYDSNFTENIVYTGQFDNGAGGGAVVFEDTYGSVVNRCKFISNGAQGYSGYSAYAASGAGGAIMLKFSQAYVSNSDFVNNWVGAGGVQFSSGAAMAIYYDYVTEAHSQNVMYTRRTSESDAGSFPHKTSHKAIHSNPYLASLANKKPTLYTQTKSSASASTSSLNGYTEPVTIQNCSFVKNAAFGLLCSNSPIPRSGQGGAISIMGSDNPGVVLRTSSVRMNMAMCDVDGVSTSIGGGLMLSLYSNFTGVSNQFEFNIAHNGVGDDIGMTSLDPTITTTALIDSTSFKAKLNSSDLVEFFAEMSESICEDAYDVRRLAEGGVEEPIHFSFRNNRGRALKSRFSRLPQIEAVTSGAAAAAPRDEVSALRQMAALEDERERVRRLSPASVGAEAEKSLTASELAALEGAHARQDLMAIAKEHPNEYSGGFSYHEDPALGGDGRKLLEPGTINMLRQNNLLSPTVLINGFMFMQNPIVLSHVLFFAGDVMELLLSDDPSSSAQSASLVIEINDKESEAESAAMTVAGFEANITLLDAYKNNDVFEVANLLLFNSTLLFSNNITVQNTSLVVGSVMTSFVHSLGLVPADLTDHDFNPTLKVNGALYTGLQSLSPEFDATVVNILRLHVFEAYLQISGCTLEVIGQLVLSSVEEEEGGDNGPQSLNVTEPFFVTLTEGGTINITESGTMVVSTLVYVDSSRMQPAIHNYGEISVGVQDNGNFAALKLNGTIAQGPAGSIDAMFSVDTQTGTFTPAAVAMFSNKDLGGSINVNFTGGTRMTYFDPPATSFLLMQYDEVEENVGPQVNYPIGLYFQESYSKVFGDELDTIVLSNMACGVVDTYYAGITTNTQLCNYCIQNTSCDYCPESNVCGGDGCGAGPVMHETCCYNDCKNRGKCELTGPVDLDTSVFKCACNFWFTGADCGYLSTYSYLFIAGGAFLLIILGVAAGYRFYYRKQKTQVLEELRQGLLFQEAGAGTKEKSAVSKHYLQALQQDLILKDVFVRYEDIKFEGKIGEGSFGVVFKGQFKGAQVAVKQMRAPLFQAFTENDIEEFRKEAYMMSRLRHPNIVLVMGIALKDQDPVQKRIKHPDEEEEEGTEKESEDKKKKPLLKTVCIITEFLDQGSLADILYGPSRLAPEIWTYELVLTCALQAARGMLYLHSHQPPICHRDLKSSNLVVDDHWVVKVTDFGMSRIIPEKHREVIEKGIGKIVDETEEPDYAGRESIFTASDLSRHTGVLRQAAKSEDDMVSMSESSNVPGSQQGQKEDLHMTSNVGTTAWCAPELLTASSKTKYSVKIDVYSFGMVMWELIERKRPFEEFTSRFDIMDAIRSGKRPEISPSCPPAYKSLIQRCWQAEPTRRPMFQYIVRYLKEELARVKRQRSASVSGPGPAGWSGGGNNGFAGSVNNQSNTLLGFGAFSPQSLTEMGPYGGRSQSVNSSNASGSVSSSLQNILPAWRTSSVTAGPGSQASSLERGSGMRASESDTARGDSDLEFASAIVTNPLMIPRQSNLTANLHSTPQKVDRSKLALNPPVDVASTPVSSSMVDPGAYAQSPGPAQPRSPAPGTGGGGKGNQWRDKYVMKFSGWKASAPDAGLPPSMVSQGGQKASAGLGFRYPASSATSNTVGDARRTSTADEVPTANDTIMNSGRTGSLHALDSVDYKEPSVPSGNSPATRLSANLRDDLINSNRSQNSRKASGSF